MRTYLEGKKNKLKEKHVESIEQLVNRVSTSLDTSFVSKVNRRSTTSLQFYRILSAKQFEIS